MIPGMVMHTCNNSTLKSEAGGLGVCGQCDIYSYIKVSLYYIRDLSKKTSPLRAKALQASSKQFKICFPRHCCALDELNRKAIHFQENIWIQSSVETCLLNDFTTSLGSCKPIATIVKQLKLKQYLKCYLNIHLFLVIQWPYIYTPQGNEFSDFSIMSQVLWFEHYIQNQILLSQQLYKKGITISILHV
jgi:hypothetical protein